MIRLLRPARQDGERGMAMLTVLLAMVIMTALGSVLLMQGIQAMPLARHQQDFEPALAAAEAGVDDFLARLDADPNYATNTGSNTALTSYVPIAANSSSTYTYRVDTSQLGSGTIGLTVTGKVGSVTRTIRVNLKRKGFLDALSQSDYSLVDPVLMPPPNVACSGSSCWLSGTASVASATTYCVKHAWETNSATGGLGPWLGSANNLPYCSQMLNYYINGSVMDGPVQSNDDFYMCGSPKFTGLVESGDPTASRSPYFYCPWQGESSPAGTRATPQLQGGPIAGQRYMEFPDTNASIASFTSATPNPSKGCLYTGPTAIVLNGTTMSVYSPNTRASNTNCLGASVPLPSNGTIYVQDVPTDATDPNYQSSCQITFGWVDDDCHRGSAFIQGTLAGQLTVAASNNIYITGDLRYDSTTANNPQRVLGLIANNYVFVNHPVSGSSDVTGTVSFGSYVNYTVPLVNPTVQAAILALQHSFAVKNFNVGSGSNVLGAVHVLGSISGEFMDITGEFSTPTQTDHGYDVAYTYDNRFRNGALVPPNFLNPISSYWHRVSFTECANGATTSSC